MWALEKECRSSRWLNFFFPAILFSPRAPLHLMYRPTPSVAFPVYFPTASLSLPSADITLQCTHGLDRVYSCACLHIFQRRGHPLIRQLLCSLRCEPANGQRLHFAPLQKSAPVGFMCVFAAVAPVGLVSQQVHW